MQRKQTMKASSTNSVRIDTSKLNAVPLPSDMIADLLDAFAFYDKEDSGYITMTHFRNIL